MTFHPVPAGDNPTITPVNGSLYLLNAAALNMLNMIAYSLAEKPTFTSIGHYEPFNNRPLWSGVYVSRELIDSLLVEMTAFISGQESMKEGVMIASSKDEVHRHGME